LRTLSKSLTIASVRQVCRQYGDRCRLMTSVDELLDELMSLRGRFKTDTAGSNEELT
jgi:hypothetical protein